MSVVHLFLDTDSPPCRAVEMVSRMVGSKIKRHYLDLLANDQFRADYLKINPLHRVPFLVDGDLKLGESRTIMRYLADRDLPHDNTLYPRDLKQRAKVDEILDLDSGTLYTLVHELLKPKFFGLSETFDEQTDIQVKGVLDYLEDRLKHNEGKRFLLSDHVTIADIALVTTLSLADICDYDLSIFPRLEGYLHRLAVSIPNYREINEGAIGNYRNFVRSMQG